MYVSTLAAIKLVLSFVFYYVIGLKYEYCKNSIIIHYLHSGALLDTVFCPVYCIREPSILLLLRSQTKFSKFSP